MKKLIFTLISLSILSASTNAQVKLTKSSEKMALTMYFINKLYVDKIDEKKLSDYVLKALIH